MDLPQPTPSRSPWQLFYGAVLRWRRRRWLGAGGRARRLPRPVISIGNLHWGGGGKTPLTIAVANHLRERGLGVAILSRGYGREDAGRREPLFVSRGQGPVVDPRQGGDEPVLLARECPGVVVVVCADRWLAGMATLDPTLAQGAPAPDLFLLDDGFSHVQLARDLDLLVFPAADPFAGARLLPTGRLREPLEATQHAQAVLLTGQNLPPDAGDQLAQRLAPFGFSGPAFAAKTLLAAPRPVGTTPLPPSGQALVVAGIARPTPFFAAARALGLPIAAERTYPDHHPYPERTLAELRQLFATSGANWVLTTSKDAVKLRDRLQLPLAELPLTCQPATTFLPWLDHQLQTLGLLRRPSTDPS